MLTEGKDSTNRKFLSKIPAEEGKFIRELESQVGLIHVRNICIEKNHIMGIYMEDYSLERIPNSIKNLIQLRELYLRSNALTSLPEGLAQLTKLRFLDLSDNKFSFFSDSLSCWLLELERKGCKISGVSTSRITAMQNIPPEEKVFIEKLEKVTGLLPMWEDIEDINPGRGESVESFFSIKDNHVNVLRIKDSDSEGFSTGIVEIISGIGHLKHLEELTIAGYTSEWSKIQTIIKENFPEKFVVKFGDYEINYLMELCFFLNDGLDDLLKRERSPLKYYGGYLNKSLHDDFFLREIFSLHEKS